MTNAGRSSTTARREITLLGQNVNSYGLDKHASGDTSFARLLRKVSELPGLARLRFVTPHPKDLSPEVIAMFGEVPNLCPRLHLPPKPDRIACWPA